MFTMAVEDGDRPFGHVATLRLGRRRFEVDAAIIFSDILVVPQAMGLEVLLKENVGPVLPKTIRTEKDLELLSIPDVEDRLHYMMEALSLTKETLAGRVPLIARAVRRPDGPAPRPHPISVPASPFPD